MSAEPLLTAEDVAEIIAILDSTDYAHVDVQTKRVSVRFAQSGDGWTQEWQHRKGETQPEGLAVAEGKLAGAQDVEGLFSVRPPLPGMFYRAPQPGAADFVNVGDQISAGTIIGIIETMKVMNSVPAGVAGEVVEIVTPDATMVDKGDILIRVRAKPL
jgi:acetyl-CoA carboxylase biotin carboxyl carrier protein